jgi:hypothetical protein
MSDQEDQKKDKAESAQTSTTRTPKHKKEEIEEDLLIKVTHATELLYLHTDVFHSINNRITTLEDILNDWTISCKNIEDKLLPKLKEFTTLTQKVSRLQLAVDIVQDSLKLPINLDKQDEIVKDIVTAQNVKEKFENQLLLRHIGNLETRLNSYETQLDHQTKLISEVLKAQQEALKEGFAHKVDFLRFKFIYLQLYNELRKRFTNLQTTEL